MVEDAKKDLVRTTFYGRLDRILQCELDNDANWRKFKNTLFLLAVITPCSTGGQDAVQGHVTYSYTTAQIVTDLRAVQCVVGRVKSRGCWGILDRSGNLARTEFISSGGQDEAGDEYL